MTNREAVVYKIENLENRDFYIGSSINISRRINKHFFELRKNIHNNTHLQRAYNKYGKDKFTYEIIEFCKEEEIVQKEQYYIDLLKPRYNICKIAYSTVGVIPSKETRIKMSKSQTGRKHTEESKEKMRELAKGRKLSQETRDKISKSQKRKKTILQFDKQGNFIREWNSILETMKEFGNVGAVLLNKRKTCGGFIWKYKNI